MLKPFCAISLKAWYRTNLSSPDGQQGTRKLKKKNFRYSLISHLVGVILDRESASQSPYRRTRRVSRRGWHLPLFFVGSAFMDYQSHTRIIVLLKHKQPHDFQKISFKDQAKCHIWRIFYRAAFTCTGFWIFLSQSTQAETYFQKESLPRFLEIWALKQKEETTKQNWESAIERNYKIVTTKAFGLHVKTFKFFKL